MHIYFLTVVKFEKIADDGNIVKTTEHYLVDALSFTEAETRIIDEMKPFISGEFLVDKIARQKINEIFFNEMKTKWYKSKVAFITFDEEKGVEKRTISTMMVEADDTSEADLLLNEAMMATMSDYEIVSITETKILDIFKYEPINE